MGPNRDRDRDESVAGNSAVLEHPLSIGAGDSARIDRALGAAWYSDEPWSLLSDLTALESRMTGSDGEHRSAERVAAAFRTAGLREVSIDTFEVQAWIRDDATLQLRAPVERSFDAIALPYSPSGSVDGRLVDVGYGTPQEIDARDVTDAIVLASTDTPPRRGRFVHRQESYSVAVDAGAAAFVFANHVQGQLPPTGTLRAGDEAEVPGLGVSHETGEWLRRFAETGGGHPEAGEMPARSLNTGDARIQCAVSATTEPAEGHTVSGVLGPETDEEVVVLAHHDAHDVGDGALDNGSGVATMVTALHVLSAIETDLDCRVRVVATSGEEVGLLGASALAEELDLDRVRSVVNVDGAGRFRDLRAFTHASDPVAELVGSVANAVDHPIRLERSPHPHSDHWPFLRTGIPTLQLHSDSGERGRGFTHTSADTLDKADPRAIREHGMLAALLVLALARTALPRLSGEGLAAAFSDAGYERGMRAMNEWPEEWE
jgi:Zn-dependent M28 family amino/carboxypeptidase